VPGFTVFTRVQPIHFIQTPTKVIILNELNAELRRIYLNVPHSPRPKPSWYGESIGHYEGDELVIDTVGISDKTYVDNYRTPHTDQIHVIERFQLIEDGRKLRSVVTVTDQGASICRGRLFSAGVGWRIGPCWKICVPRITPTFSAMTTITFHKRPSRTSERRSCASDANDQEKH
jgi:hypothetical protein